MQVRLRDGLSEGQRRPAIANIQAATRMKDWRLSQGDYAVTGAPVVVEQLSHSISRSTLILLLGAVLVMALTLLLVFRARLRLLPLLVALCATAVTFGAMSVLGIPLTMASIAVIPVLIGLAVDYAIQVQSRLQEHGDLPLARGRRAAWRARARPTVVIAACATAAGFLVLALSPVPMVRGFGLLLVVGIVLALLSALTLGVAAQALAGAAAAGIGPPARRVAGRRRRRRRPGAEPGRSCAARALWGGAGRFVRGSGRRALGAAVAHPGPRARDRRARGGRRLGPRRPGRAWSPTCRSSSRRS